MKYLFLPLLLTMNTLIFDFNKDTQAQTWRVVDDVVMGGKSSGTFRVNEDGHGVFEGTVSLENNGGFSSVRHRLARVPLAGHMRVVLRLRGDGKNYQFRVKADAQREYAYITTFSTSGEWQEVEIALADMYPSFRGRRLDQPNFAHDHLEEITFLIANKQNERFKLIIDKIALR